MLYGLRKVLVVLFLPLISPGSYYFGLWRWPLCVGLCNFGSYGVLRICIYVLQYIRCIYGVHTAFVCIICYGLRYVYAILVRMYGNQFVFMKPLTYPWTHVKSTYARQHIPYIREKDQLEYTCNCWYEFLVSTYTYLVGSLYISVLLVMHPT